MATAATGMIASTVSPRARLMISSAASTPATSSTEFTMVMSPVCRNEDSASTSVVILVMIWPDRECS